MLRRKTTGRSLLCWIGLSSALILAGCASPQTRTSYVTPEVPSQLRDCRQAPSWSTYERRARKAQRYATQAEVAEFIAVLSAAHADCRSKLAAVNRLLVKVEARARRE